MKEELQYLVSKSQSLYEDIGIFKKHEINIKFLEETIEYFQGNLRNLDAFIHQNNIRYDRVNDSQLFAMYRSYEENREFLDRFLIQLESAYRILYISNKVYDMYQNEQDMKRRKFILSSYFLQYEKEYRLYQGAKVLEFAITDKDILEKMQYLLLEIKKMKNDTINKEEKEPKKEDDKKQEEKKSFVNLDIDQRIKSEFTSIYGRNMYYFQRPYTRQQSIVALNEMNDFFIQNSDVIDYINNLDINSINPIDRMIVEQMKRILKDIEDYPDILSSKNKTR